MYYLVGKFNWKDIANAVKNIKANFKNQGNIEKALKILRGFLKKDGWFATKVFTDAFIKDLSFGILIAAEQGRDIGKDLAEKLIALHVLSDAINSADLKISTYLDEDINNIKESLNLIDKIQNFYIKGDALKYTKLATLYDNSFIKKITSNTYFGNGSIIVEDIHYWNSGGHYDAFTNSFDNKINKNKLENISKIIYITQIMLIIT